MIPEITTRLIIYKRLLELIDAGQVFGMCVELALLTCNAKVSIERDFPELWDQRPEGIENTDAGYWFEREAHNRKYARRENMLKRRECVARAIRQCESSN